MILFLVSRQEQNSVCILFQLAGFLQIGGECNYGEPFTAAVQKDNFYGVQFHPERSGAAGAKLLKNFLEM